MTEPKWPPLNWNEGFHWINEYVENVLKDALSSHKETNGRSGSKLKSELFQTHHYVIVRFHVPASINGNQLRVHASRYRVKIEGLPGGEVQQVSLPALVYPETSRALYKDGILQVKLQKQKTEERFEEVDIRYR